MQTRDKIIWYDKVLREHSLRAAVALDAPWGWAHLIRVHGVAHVLNKLMVKPLGREEYAMVLKSIGLAAEGAMRVYATHRVYHSQMQWYDKHYRVYGKPYKDDEGRCYEIFIIESRKPGGLVKAKKILLDG